MMPTRAYFDHNATAPLRPEAAALLADLVGAFPANAGSAHAAGRRARRLVEEARAQVAGLVGARPEAVVFTASGTEACNLALFGVAGQATGRHLLSTAIEHAAVLGPLERLAAMGWEVELAPVGRSGKVDAAEFAARLRDDTALAAVMAANNETGVLQPIEEIGAACRARSVPFFVDGIQAAGRLPIDLRRAPVDLLALSAHKLGGPQGAGALYVGPGVGLAPQIVGGGQEGGLRAGTENVAALAAFGAAAEAAGRSLAAESRPMRALLQRLIEEVTARVPGAILVGEAPERLPNTALFSVPHDDEEMLILALDRRGFEVSAGAACAAGAHRRSHVVQAMGLSAPGRAVVRVSLGAGNTEAEVVAFAAALAALVAAVGESTIAAAAMVGR